MTVCQGHPAAGRQSAGSRALDPILVAQTVSIASRASVLASPVASSFCTPANIFPDHGYA